MGGALEGEEGTARTEPWGEPGRADTADREAVEGVGAGRGVGRTRMVGGGAVGEDARPGTRPGPSVRRGAPLSRGSLSLCGVFLALFVPFRVVRALALFP